MGQDKEKWCAWALPDGYRQAESLDVLKNRKQLQAVGLLQLALMAAALLLGFLTAPPLEAPLSAEGLLLRGGAALLGMGLYIVLHEGVHGIYIWGYSGRKAFYGFKGVYAYAGSQAYFHRGPYLVIALAPVALWGAVLACGCALVSADWFWTLYVVQIFNFSGAAGDFYVTYRILGMPKEVLVKDTGIAMAVYAPSGEAT